MAVCGKIGVFFWKYGKIALSLQRETIRQEFMNYTETVVVKKPSRKLEEAIRKIGVQKYLRLEKLCSDEIQPTRIVKV